MPDEITFLDDTCETCKFHLPARDIYGDFQESGWCRRFPPQIRADGFGVWPVVSPNQWCGEYKISEEIKA